MIDRSRPTVCLHPVWFLVGIGLAIILAALNWNSVEEVGWASKIVLAVTLVGPACALVTIGSLRFRDLADVTFRKLGYTCPKCSFKLWGQPDHHVSCDDCGARML